MEWARLGSGIHHIVFHFWKSDSSIDATFSRYGLEFDIYVQILSLYLSIDAILLSLEK